MTSQSYTMSENTEYTEQNEGIDSGSENEFPNHIDLGVAERFLANPDNIDLDSASTIDDNAAEVLAKHQGELFLSGLNELSSATAKALSLHQGAIFLYGLSKLPDDTALSLSGHKGPLFISSDIEISDYAATIYLSRAIQHAIADDEFNIAISIDHPEITITEQATEWERRGDCWSKTCYGEGPKGRVKIEFMVHFEPRSNKVKGYFCTVLDL